MLDEDSQNGQSCKVVIVGGSGVGKTSIISRYINDTFSSILMATTGASFTTKTLYIEDENQSVNFEIWDTAGQERYRALAKVFYRNASVCILVYDITRRTSFEELKKYWINEFKENTPKNSILALAGNKSDMYEYEEVTSEEGKQFAQEIGAIFQLTSAKSASGVDELFKNIGKKFLHPDEEDISNLIKEEAEEKSRRKKIKDTKEKEGKKKCCG